MSTRRTVVSSLPSGAPIGLADRYRALLLHAWGRDDSNNGSNTTQGRPRLARDDGSAGSQRRPNVGAVTALRTLSALTVAALMAIVSATPVMSAPRQPAAPCVLSTGVTFASYRGAVEIHGTSGADTIDCRANAKLVFRIYGHGGSDTITGGGRGDLIWVSGAGRSVVHGGPGDDALVADGATGDFFGDAGADVISLYPGAEGSIAAGGDGNDAIAGSPFRDVLLGNAGDDTLDGNGGDDEITGGGGIDDMTGGDGNDLLSDDSPEADAFDAGDGTDLCTDDDGYGTATDGRIGYLGATQNDNLTGCEVITVPASAP